jgi:ABC-2 type transport system permease protein
VIGWTIGLSAVGVFYGAMWPAFNDPEILETFESYPSGLMEALNYTDISTAAGYINATVYGLIVANLTVVFAVMTGTRLIAGDENAGTLDLVLSLPKSRTDTALQRFAAYLVSLFVILAGLLVLMAVLRGPAELDGVTVTGLAAMHIHAFLFGGFFGALAFGAGAATGRKSVAIGASVGVAIIGFAANGLLPQVDGLEWTRSWSPYDWLNGGVPLRNGVQTGDVLLMAVLIAALVGIGTVLFNRRDINV